MAGKLTPEEASALGRIGGKASAKARAERSKMRADILAKSRFERRADDMAEVIIAAALGDGDFASLSPKDRAVFALKALEYGIGRPRQSEPATPAEQEEQTGIAFLVKEEDLILDALAGVKSNVAPF